jgi:hypothetical protein
VQLLQAHDVGGSVGDVLRLLLQAQRARGRAEVRGEAADEGRREGRADQHVEGHRAEAAHPSRRVGRRGCAAGREPVGVSKVSQTRR